MTVIEWVQLSVLIVAIGLSITFSIIVLVKSIREGFTRKRTATFVLALGLLFITYLAYNAQEIHPADGVQIMLVTGLVAVTGVYALFTARQANASVRMAEEMREQRYDAVRPVIDIQHSGDRDRRLGELAATKEEIVSGGLTCILHNIGLGPAIDVCSFTQLNSGERHPYDFGVLGIGGKSDPKILSVDVESDRNRLLAYYKDTYGRKIESSREVRETEGTKWELGPLQIRVIDKEDQND